MTSCDIYHQGKNLEKTIADPTWPPLGSALKATTFSWRLPGWPGTIGTGGSHRPSKWWTRRVQFHPVGHVICHDIWVNYNISLTWNKAILGWFLLLTMIPVRENSEVVIIYPNMYTYMYIYTYVESPTIWRYLSICIHIYIYLSILYIYIHV